MGPGFPVRITESINDMVDGLDFALKALNRKMTACGESEITRGQLMILVEIKRGNIEAMNRVCKNLEHLLDGLKGIENDR